MQSQSTLYWLQIYQVVYIKIPTAFCMQTIALETFFVNIDKPILKFVLKCETLRRAAVSKLSYKDACTLISGIREC